MVRSPLVLALAVTLPSLACVESTTDEDSSESGCLPGSQDCAAEDESSTSGQGDGDGDDQTEGEGDGDGEAEGDGDGEDGPCHPLMISCSTIGETCTWDGEQFLCAPSMIKLGDSCVPDMPQCVSGFCAPMDRVPGCPSTHCCASFCNLDSPFCTTEGTSCVEYFPPGATSPEVGACLGG
ncbi:MAG: hypothetical protein R6X02_05930 [Enhygromyxa sp.]